MKSKTILMTAAVAMVAGLLFVQMGWPGTPACTLQTASAQDNPCLAQDATISALQVEVLGAQATMNAQAANYEATIAVMEDGSSGDVSGEAAMPAPGNALFFDDFDDNETGWSLFSVPEGRVSLADGFMRLNSNPCARLWVPIPDLTVGDEFYAEAEIRLGEGTLQSSSGRILVGFAVGNSSSDQYHAFVISNRRNRPDNVVLIDTVNQSFIFDTEYNVDLINENAPVRVGIGYEGGILTLYVEDEAYDAAPVITHGEEIGLFAVSLNVRADDPLDCLNAVSTETYFDNLMVREAR